MTSQALEAAPSLLTPREEQILQALAASGGTDKQIAKQFALSQGTVKAHLHHLRLKTGCATRSQLILWAINRKEPV